MLMCILAFVARHPPFAPDDKEIAVIVQYKAQPSKEHEAILALTDLIQEVRKEPYFVKIKLHVDPKDKTNIMLYEVWRDEAYYNTKHMNTAHLQRFIESSRAFLTGPPEITIWKVDKVF